MKNIIIIILILIIVLLIFSNKKELFKVDENIYIDHKYNKKKIDLIENINIINNNENILIIPKYASKNETKLLILNFNDTNPTINIKINSIPQKLTIMDKLSEIIIKNNNFNFIMKNEIPTKIPKRICQTAKKMTVSINKYLSIRSIIDNNPNYEYNFFDNDKSIKFIQNNFKKDVVDSYNKLIPGAYKADLFRYCYLYIHGGIYIDCKMICRINFDELLEDYDLIFVIDIGPNAYWNGFICAKPGLEIFKNCIDNIVKNVKEEYYGDNVLDITGPRLLYRNMNVNNIKYKTLTFNHIKHGDPKNAIEDMGKKILNTSYPTYYEENDYRNNNYYDKYWYSRNVYEKNI